MAATERSKLTPSSGRPPAFASLERQRPTWLALALFVATLAAYLPVIWNGFVWDDNDYIINNLTLRSLDGLGRIWGKLTATPQYYPLVHTSFWIEYQLWGPNPICYHVDNVLLHALAALLLWRVLAILRLNGAWLVATVFALHPVHVESVAWATERKNVLSAVFYLSAALLYLHFVAQRESARANNGNTKLLYAGAFGFFLCALWSKTVTCSLPAALLLVVYWKRGTITRKDFWPLLPFFAVGVVMSLITSILERTHVGASGPEWSFDLGERILIAGRAVWFYAAKLAWPANLTFIYPRWKLETGTWWQWLFPVASAGVVILFWSLRNRWGRGPLVAVLFFAGTLFPALGFANVYPMLYSFVADHFQYLASVGLIALAVAGICRFTPKPALLLAPLLFIEALLTWQQTQVYRDLETLWRDTLRKNPECWLAHNNLGQILLDRNQPEEALVHFQKALELKPDAPDFRNNVGAALFKAGRLEEAIVHYRESIRMDPKSYVAHYNLANVLSLMGRFDEAIPEFRTAVSFKSDLAEAYSNLGFSLLQKNEIDDAISNFGTALKISPGFAAAHYNLGLALYQKGQFDEAALQFLEAIRLQGDYAEAHNNLGAVFYLKGRTNEAAAQFLYALQIKPNFADAHENLGVVLLNTRQVDDAIMHLQKAVELNPNNARARKNLEIAHGLK